MKKTWLLYSIGLLFTFKSYSQSIPFGNSQDSISVIVYYNYDPNVFVEKFYVYYYKPVSYDSLSPAIIYIHGLGGSGASMSVLDSIADRRNALLIGLTMDIHNDWPYAYTRTDSCWYIYWYVPVIKQLYKHTILRESRNSIPVYLTGFSAGGQFVTRYMLIRQGIPDSIPIRMAVSVNPYSYTFCTDSLNGVEMGYPCGISRDSIISGSLCSPLQTWYLPFECNEHVIQYYNENYGMLIGTTDTANFGLGWACMDVQGADRYERAQNFYNFSDSNAIARGTTLMWAYDSVVGVAHNSNLMYNTKRNPTDTSTIAETLLFDTPWHPVPQLAPLASFIADTTNVFLPGATVQFFNNSIMAASYLWNFGDSTTSIFFNPSHTYTIADTFTVTLKAINGTGCENEMIKRNYIIVKNSTGIEQPTSSSTLSIYPNPTNGKFVIKIQNGLQDGIIEIYNVLGEKVYGSYGNPLITNGLITIDLSAQRTGVYFIAIKTAKGNYYGKVVIPTLNMF